MNENPQTEYGVLIAQKAERLVTGLYLVTDLIDSEEPIKRRLRENALLLLSSMNTVAQQEVKDRIKEFKVSLRSVTEIISLLHVAIRSGMISPMNGQLLTEGFRSLQLTLEKKQPRLTEDMLLVENEHILKDSATFTDAITGSSYDAIMPRMLRHSAHAQIEDKGQELKRTEGVLKDSVMKNEDRVSLSFKKTTELGQAHAVGLHTPYKQRKLSRREQILGLFVRGVDVSIKDISSRIKGCSEKTIQRELNMLVYQNNIERIGEKRWSRYVLR